MSNTAENTEKIIETDEDTRVEDQNDDSGSIYPFDPINENIDIGETPFSVFEYLRQLNKGKVNVNPEFQRNKVWDIEECKIYFPNLFFHERNKKTVTYMLKDCSGKIVYHLAALNDKFMDSCNLGLDRTQMLKHFTADAKLDETASLQGNASRKTDFTFAFMNGNGLPENVCCELHLKLCYNDAYPGDTSYSKDRRIYFHEGKQNIQQGKILIGHIGKHL
jgi:hypothetical protein